MLIFLIGILNEKFDIKSLIIYVIFGENPTIHYSRPVLNRRVSLNTNELYDQLFQRSNPFFCRISDVLLSKLFTRFLPLFSFTWLLRNPLGA